jgi:hypothetical protein
MAKRKAAKPKLPRFRMPPPEKLHRDEKKERSRRACRRFRSRREEQQ